MYRIKIKVKTHPINTRVTRLLLAVAALFTTVIVGFKLYRIAILHADKMEGELSGWFDKDAFVPDKLPTDLVPDMYTLSINATNVTFSGNVTIKVICRKNTSYLLLHAAPSLRIKSAEVKDLTEKNFRVRLFERLRSSNMLIVKATGRQFIPPRTYMVAISFEGETLRYPEHKTGLVSVQHPGGYESIMFLNEGRASRGVFPSFNRHSSRAGFKLDGVVRRGMVICSSQHPIEDRDDEMIQDNGGPGDLFRVRFGTIDAITSDRLSWFQTNLHNSALGSGVVMWNTEKRLGLMEEPRQLFETSRTAVTRIYPSLTIPKRIHVVHLPDFDKTMVCWGIIYSSRFEANTEQLEIRERQAWRFRFQFQATTMLASFTFGHTVTPRWANDMWFFAGLSAAIAYDSMEVHESFRRQKPWLVSYRRRAFSFSDALNRLTPDTFDFAGGRDPAMISRAFLLFLLYKDCLLGKKNFREKVRGFISKYKFTTTNSDSAVDILTGMSTYQKSYFATWANKPSHPVLIVQLANGDTEKSEVTVRQTYFKTSFVSVNDTWVIPLLPVWIHLNGTAKALTRRLLYGDFNTVMNLGSMHQGALLLFHDVASLSRTLYDSRLWGLLFALLDGPEFAAVPTVNRASLQQDLGAFLRNGDVGVTLYIAGIRYIWRETSRAVWRAFAKEYREIRKMAAKMPLAQLDELVRSITSWHQPVNTSAGDITEFDLDTRPFVEEVMCLVSGAQICEEHDTDLDEWGFDI
ncbi:membrane alanyl aminopeptidase-like [Dermacentor albipictus]|uniref:membrane alanyl aminopeptidase-like n=1 Tax=Dermacentor albipictus TaxID=60249 RepID=UPI0031FC000F